MIFVVPFTETLFLSLMGLAVLFLGLITLVLCIKLPGRSAQAPEAPVSAPPQVIPPAAAPPLQAPAPGSHGEICLYNVDDTTAALLMAVIADKLGVPLNQLRFVSIREIEN